MKIKQIAALFICVILLAACTPVLSSPSLSTSSVSVLQEQTSESETSILLPTGVDIRFLYDNAVEVISNSGGGTKNSGWIEIVDSGLYYIFSQGKTYGIKERNLETGAETILLQTNEHVFTSFIRMDDTRFLLESPVDLMPEGETDSPTFSRSFLYEYDLANKQFRSLTELYGLEDYSKGGTAILDGKEYTFEGPSVLFYAYSNGYIYLDSHEDSYLLQGARFVLRIAPDGTVKKLPVEVAEANYIYGSSVSVSGDFVYIASVDNTLYTIHEDSTKEKPVISWSGEVFSVNVQDGYVYLQTNGLGRNVLDSGRVYNRVDLRQKVSSGEATAGTGKSYTYAYVTPLVGDMYQELILGFDSGEDSGEGDCISEEVQYYTWDGQLQYTFSAFEHLGYNRGYTLEGEILYYLDSYDDNIVLKTMLPTE